MITITIGWWIAPAIITVASFAWAWFAAMPDRHPTYGDGIVGAMFIGVAVIVSLSAWLIWALT